MLALSPASSKCLLCLLQELYTALNSSKPGWGFPRKFSPGPTSLGSRTRVCHSVPLSSLYTGEVEPAAHWRLSFLSPPPTSDPPFGRKSFEQTLTVELSGTAGEPGAQLVGCPWGN